MTAEKKAVPKAVPSKTNSTKATAPSRTVAAVKKVSVKRTRSTVARKVVPKQPQTGIEKKTKKKKTDKKKLQSAKGEMARDSFTMPKEEYAQFAILKARLSDMGQPAKKSELLRAGIKLLADMTDVRLKKTMAAVPVIKTGRPKKKK